jgi:hypothetical protein
LVTAFVCTNSRTLTAIQFPFSRCVFLYLEIASDTRAIIIR